MIRAERLEVRFGSIRGLAVEELEIPAGTRQGVTGLNGSGKSTLLRVLAGLLRPTSGRVTGLPPPGRAVLVHQRPHLFRGTARDNVALALSLHHRPLREASGWLERLGAAHVVDRPARALSAGERQRVALARALAVRPTLLLLDEPLAALDGEGRRRLLGILDGYEGTVVVAAPAMDEVRVDGLLELRAPRGG